MSGYIAVPEEILSSLSGEQEATSFIEIEPVSISLVERGIWAGLVVLGVAWGFVTALSLKDPNFFIYPTTAIYGCIAILGLLITALVDSKRNK